MGKVIILSETTKNPLQVIGESAGICWESDTSDKIKNIRRAITCILDGHGRVTEYPSIHMVLDGYSARVIREWYTHIGGGPTRLQSSTRYVSADGFTYVTPKSVMKSDEAEEIFENTMSNIQEGYNKLIELGIPKEDAAMVLPLGMTTKIVDKRNLRNLIDMSRQRMCTRAYWEYREMFSDIMKALSDYSNEWKWIVENLLYPKCEVTKFCPEKNSCGRRDHDPTAKKVPSLEELTNLFS